MSAAFRLTIDGAPALLVHAIDIAERAHLASALHVIARPAPDEASLPASADLLGAKASLEIASNDPQSAEPRRFHGVVDAIDVSAEGARITVVPRVMLLADGADHRVFLDKDAVTIAEDLLKGAGLTLDVRVSDRPKPRLQCVQAFEPVLGFVLRVLAEDGVSLWVEHTAEEDIVVLGADGAACADLPGGAHLRFRPTEGLTGGEAITDLQVEHALTHDGAAVADHDPDHPAVDQSASVGESRYPLFAYPGGQRSPKEGEARARLLLEEARSEKTVLHGRATCRRMAVGFVIEIAEAPRPEQNGRFRVMEVRQTGRDAGASGEQPRFETAFRAVPADVPVRPRRLRSPGLGGLQTMTVTGPAGAEIHTDSRGAIKARFRWDRLSPSSDAASAWIRPMMPALSGGFFLPRTGWEVLVGFAGEPSATGDTPVELGRLINGEAPPAESLPAQKVRSNWGTRTTPGGGKENLLRFDDTAGNEGMHLGASSAYNERTENDKVVSVTANETVTVGGDHLNTVTIQQEIGVTGAQSMSVGGNRDVTTVGILSISAASESVTVGGNRSLTIGGDYENKAASLARVVGAAENVLAIAETNRHVSGASSIAVGGTWAEVGGVSASIGVLGASTLTAGGPLSISASNVSINATVLSESYAGLYKANAGGKITVKAASVTIKSGGVLSAKGADVFFKAKSRIVIKGGGVTITITPGSIKVKGKLDGASTSVATTKQEIR